jgi:hypothetical protein
VTAELKPHEAPKEAAALDPHFEEEVMNQGIKLFNDKPKKVRLLFFLLEASTLELRFVHADHWLLCRYLLPVQGVELLLSKGVLPRNADELADFLFGCEELQKEKVGEYLVRFLKPTYLSAPLTDGTR